MLIPTIIMGVIAIALLFIAYQKGGRGTYSGIKISREYVNTDCTVINFCLHNSWHDSSSHSCWNDIKVDRRGIWFSRYPNWFSNGWSYARWSLCYYAHCCWIPAGRSGCGNHGSILDCMVIVGDYAVATGYRHTGLEIHTDSPCLHLFLPANSWTNS